MTDYHTRDGLVKFRARTARLAFRAGILMLAAVLFAAFQTDVLQEPRVFAPSLAVGLVLASFSVIRWEEALTRRYGEVLLWLGAAAIIAAISILSSVPALENLTITLYFGVAAFSAALARRSVHVLNTVVLILALVLTPYAYGSGPRPLEELVVPVLSLVVVATVAGMIGGAFRRETLRGELRLLDLRRREEDFKRLYEVSRTMAAGDSLSRVLPAVVGRIGSYLNAQLGMVLLHDATRHDLKVVSPIWTQSNALAVEDCRVPLDEEGELQRVFLSGHPALHRGLDEDPDSHPLLGELGVREAMIAPLRIEQRPLGVIVVADKERAEFDEVDLEQLTSLAAAAALVVAQLGRYQEAAETGRRMEELARMKSDFVSVVSHELRTPLTSIIGSLDTVARPQLAPRKEAARDLIASARKQADRLRRLIEDLLTFSRIENRALPQHPEQFAVDAFLKEVVAGIPGAEEAVQVSVDPPNLELEADVDHLRRIIINLVENALKYAPGSPVEVTAQRRGEQAALSVVDHGPGIPAERRRRAFDRFTQLEPSQTRAHGGTGLGLSIVGGLTEAMGGEISLDETPGGGASFTILLPLRPPLRSRQPG